MDLSTNYLGMKLRTPLVASASPLSRNVDDVKRLEEAGAAAVVFHSVFAEQLQSSAKAADFRVDPELYLNHIAQAKESVSIPVIGSVNAAAPGSWVGYVRRARLQGQCWATPKVPSTQNSRSAEGEIHPTSSSTMDHHVLIAEGIPRLVCERSLLLWAARFCRASEFDALLVCLEHSPRQRRPAANLTTSLRKLMSGELRL